MKLIHCADLHLDSRLHTHLNREQAKLRRDELLRNFDRLADYASEHCVEVILIAGDLFDRDSVSALTRNVVLSVIKAHPRIRFYYLRGNHDKADCLGSGAPGAEELPANLFLFGSRWKTYKEGINGAVAISGIELTRENSSQAASSLRLDPACFNIVMLHGQTEMSAGPDGSGNTFRNADMPRAEGIGTVRLRALRGKGIDYLALGHIHSWKKDALDGRGIYCYPGCLEGRGFDECGPHGFALLEIDEKTLSMSQKFIPFAQRILYAVEADVTGCSTTAQMERVVVRSLADSGCTGKDMADVTLCGELDVDCEKDTQYLAQGLAGRCFFARLRDRTSLRIDPENYLYDTSLRGEFVRTVMEDDSIPEEEKSAVIRWGFCAMDGEKL